MLCPSCESVEMSKWFGQDLCSNCGYTQGPIDTPPFRIKAESMQVLQPPTEEMR